MDNYIVGAVGDKRVEIGEKDKSKRTCRFCNRKSDSTTFNNEAHAISVALGNSQLCYMKNVIRDLVRPLNLMRIIM